MLIESEDHFRSITSLLEEAFIKEEESFRDINECTFLDVEEEENLASMHPFYEENYYD